MWSNETVVTNMDDLSFDKPHTYYRLGDWCVASSSFPPFVWELYRPWYPNQRFAASRDMGAIRAAMRLHGSR